MPRLRAPDGTRLAAKAFPPGAPLLPGTRRCLALVLALGPLLGGCANNPIARQLAASFDTPAPTAAGPPAAVATNSAAQGQAGANPAAGIAAATPLAPPSGNASTANPSPSTPAKPDPKGPRAGAKGSAQGGTAGSASAQAPTKPRAAAPTPAAAPYRVTLKLPGADPSAPAEVVTRALRAAGVSFEVETIERIGAGSDGANSSRPAALRSTPAPAMR